MSTRFDVAIVGSGFAGSILARALVRAGRDVVLFERGSHPRFALGESSTPLAAIALERLASTYDMPDLSDLAAHGRWVTARPELRCGLKRGFTFFAHRAGRQFENDPRNGSRLLVAASPDDAIADVHWLRADVDADLVRRAAEAGVTYLDRAEVRGLELGGERSRLSVERAGEEEEIEAGFVVDATGGSGFLAQALEIPSLSEEVPFSSRLGASHFENVRLFSDVALEAGAHMEGSPYPDDLAAVHHLTDVGWMYVLRFDHGLTSAGFVLDDRKIRRLGLELEGSLPEEVWRAVLERYPSLHDQFAGAVPIRPLTLSGRLQRRLASASGHGWAVLPHTYAFFDPMFSTGIAWSLLGVERLVELLAEPEPDDRGLREYDRLLSSEADHVGSLIETATRRMSRFPAFVDWSMAYFAAASLNEVRQRLLPPPASLRSWAWDGFLGARAPEILAAFESVRASESLAEAIEPINLAGLARDEKANLYEVDLEELVRSSDIIGLSKDEMRRSLPRLRGEPAGAERPTG